MNDRSYLHCRRLSDTWRELEEGLAVPLRLNNTDSFEARSF